MSSKEQPIVIQGPGNPCDCPWEDEPQISVVKEVTAAGHDTPGSLIMVCAICQAVWAMDTHWKEDVI